ncbi:ATP-binding cassette domain-containing protein [Chitinophaga agrisoli]|uniref:ATP-binding cassette domain-containing protein n=1 Tax=Chitinophaga agrisoli TaxID=2607653 RepID=A0A5B2W1E3_9BACT|nr:ATP-binding cassette domain-containing protein [Chitinophaga agrisoli]KAA2245793.1 ATP-binding cassette domain-containing protein [Chitinophaga agrisoli]
MSENAAPFLTLEHITVRYLDKTLFTGLNWEILEGQQWAITGNSGSGKTALLNTIAGRFNVINGGIHYHFYEHYRQAHTITDPYFTYRNLLAHVAHHHKFRNRSNTTDFYYQQRFNSMDANDAPTVRQYLYGEEATAIAEEPLLAPLRITPLLDKELIKLSNGETRRVMIASALLQKPVLLMLDNPFTGLDVQTRAQFMEMVDHIITSGINVLLVTSPGEIPANITHVLTLEDGAISGRYTRNEFLQQALPAQAQAAAPAINEQQLRELVQPAARSFDTIVKMANIHVQYGDNVILDNINWTVKPNEKWALLGPNGAGKSTLLSLINADNPQAYANELYLFDRKRGSGESIWDIKRKIGFVSPELHQYFPAGNNCLQVVCSGFHDIIGATRAATPEQAQHALGWMEILGIAAFSTHSFKLAPESIQRLALLARALVKDPPLLIFDEPCQGLDAQQKQHFKQVIDTLCAVMELTLIFVTHYQDEIPAAVTKVLRLEKGKVVQAE